MKQIFIPSKIKKSMIEDFKTTEVTLWSALGYKTNSGFAKSLRAAALERGGVIYTGKKGGEFTPDCYTTFETADKTMTQLFSNRVSLVVNFESGIITVYVNGEEESTHKNMTIKEFGELQMSLLDLAEQLK